MSIGRLLSGDIEGYFAEHADRAGTFWLFQHIPKTAGSSFRAELAAHLKPDANIFANAGKDNAHRAGDLLQAALDRFLAEAKATPFRFASGHLRRAQVAAVEAAMPGVRLVTMLRSPLTRVVSDYRYQRTPKHPPWERFIERYPTLESYVESPVSQNRLFNFLARDPGVSVEDVIRDLDERYVFVGVTEMYPLCRRALFALLDVAPRAQKRLNETQDTPENAVDAFAAARPLIRRRNALDIAIHEHFRKRYVALRPRLVEFLGARRAGA